MSTCCHKNERIADNVLYGGCGCNGNGSDASHQGFASGGCPCAEQSNGCSHCENGQNPLSSALCGLSKAIYKIVNGFDNTLSGC